MTDEILIKSTSNQSAEVSPVVIRPGKQTRLVFIPQLVNNPNNPADTVRGHLVYQRKAAGQQWESLASINLKELKGGEGVRLELKSAAVRKLFETVSELYAIHAKDGLPANEQKYVRSSPVLRELANLPTPELHQLADANTTLGSVVLGKLVAWASTSANKKNALASALEALTLDQLDNISHFAGLARLRAAMQCWDEYLTAPTAKMLEEEHWQDTFVKHQFLLENLFSRPVSIRRGKAFLGGKSVDNEHGKVVDYLLEHDLVDAAQLVEIKTPNTQLLQKTPYRDGTYAASRDLAGSIAQVLTYADTFRRNAASLGATFQGSLPMVVVVGTSDELDSPEKVRSFDLVRGELKDVSVFTFDEVFGRTKKLVEIWLS